MLVMPLHGIQETGLEPHGLNLRTLHPLRLRTYLSNRAQMTPDAIDLGVSSTPDLARVQYGICCLQIVLLPAWGPLILLLWFHLLCAFVNVVGSSMLLH